MRRAAISSLVVLFVSSSAFAGEITFAPNEITIYPGDSTTLSLDLIITHSDLGAFEAVDVIVGSNDLQITNFVFADFVRFFDSSGSDTSKYSSGWKFGFFGPLYSPDFLLGTLHVDASGLPPGRFTVEIDSSPRTAMALGSNTEGIAGEASVNIIDFEYTCAVVSAPSTLEQSTSLPTQPPDVQLGQTFYVEFWAMDAGDVSTGIISAYTDLDFPEDIVTCGAVGHSSLFGEFPSGTCSTGLFVDELGGSQLLENVGVEPEWARVAYVQFSCGAVGTAEFVLGPADLESSAARRNVSNSQISYGRCSIECRLCPCIYDLDATCAVAEGDLGLFAACWNCFDYEPCWEIEFCASRDFDCNGRVAGGDLGWFAAGWQKECSQIDSVNDYPLCRACDGPIQCSPAISPSGAISRSIAMTSEGFPVKDDGVVELALRLRQNPDEGEFLLRNWDWAPAEIAAGERLWAEIWIRDQSRTSHGLTAAFADVHFDPEVFSVVSVRSGEGFTLFVEQRQDLADGLVPRVGGATMARGRALNEWSLLSVVELQALTDVDTPIVSITPSVGDAISRWGKGTVPKEQIRVIASDRRKSTRQQR